MIWNKNFDSFMSQEPIRWRVTAALSGSEPLNSTNVLHVGIFFTKNDFRQIVIDEIILF